MTNITKTLFYFILMNLIKRCDVKKLSYFSKLYLKTFKFFKLFDIKRKIIIEFHIDDFFEHNNFNVLLKT